jgi:hypothetical protein
MDERGTEDELDVVLVFDKSPQKKRSFPARRADFIGKPRIVG